MIDSGSKVNPAMKRSAESEETTNTIESKVKDVAAFNKPENQELESPLKKKIATNISIKLGDTAKSSKSSAPALKPKIGKAALAFTQDDDDEEEEMPPEARMRMKNIGRNTPTSSGPNSFGKSRMGFCDSNKMYERKLKEIQDQEEEEEED